MGSDPRIKMKKKLLLMGKSGSGKTSMRSIIFANYIARDTRRLAATIDVEHSHVRLLGNLTLNLWDCGGLEVFIYVFDVESRELEKDLHYYQSCLEAIIQSSPKAKVFCLIHKMDLIEEEQRDLIFDERRKQLVELSLPLECKCFSTSIWDETPYKAWSNIVYMLIPNVAQVERSLGEFADIMEANEVLLFEKSTFLIIAHAQRAEHRDIHRFEKISNIIKQFKLSCIKLAAQFTYMEVRNSKFSAFLDAFTNHTYLCVVMPESSFSTPLMQLNIRAARKHFEALEKAVENDNANSKNGR